MRSRPGLRRGLALAAAAVLVAAACSKTPHFVPDDTGGAGSTGVGTAGSTGSGMPNPCAGADAGTPCAAGQCDGTGHCVECLVDADCGTPADCTVRVCSAGHCATNPVEMGMPAPGQTPGDCKKAVCDGMGNVTTVADDGDPPPNPDACHTAGCSGGSVTVTMVNVPSSGSVCIADGCDPATGVYHNPTNEGGSCGNCSVCQQGSCVDVCAAMGCVCGGGATCVCG